MDSLLPSDLHTASSPSPTSLPSSPSIRRDNDHSASPLTPAMASTTASATAAWHNLVTGGAGGRGGGGARGGGPTAHQSSTAEAEWLAADIGKSTILDSV